MGYSNMLQKLFFVIVFFIVTPLSYGNSIDSLLFDLENSIKQKEEYQKDKVETLQQLKKLRGETTELIVEYGLNRKLVADYQTFIIDSSYVYAVRNLSVAKELKNEDKISEAKRELAWVLFLSGYEIEAYKLLNSIDKDKLSNKYLVGYYRSLYDFNNGLRLSSDNKRIKQNYDEITVAYMDTLSLYVDKDNSHMLSLIEQQYRIERKIEDGLRVNELHIKEQDTESKYLSHLYYNRAVMYKMKAEPDSAKIFFIKSAIVDIKKSLKSNASLAELALIYYKEGDFERANMYINSAMDDANYYNSGHRYKFIASVLPSIHEEYQAEINNSNKGLRKYGSITSVMLVLLLITISLVYFQLKKLSKAKEETRLANGDLKTLNVNLLELNSKLQESNMIKEQYIATFLTICSNYIDKIDNYQNMVKREIQNNNVAELFKSTKSKRLIDAEVAAFYKNFDSTFLSIYPDFVVKLNELLMSDKQITVKKDELLNTELRIFALIRLGISDSPQIAKLLRYSIHTIYNYRAKVKNSANGDKETFEQRVMQIGVASR